MATVADMLPLIVIVGPTASGKTALAIELAEQYGGEIICADSRTVYRDMNMGTAKPTPEERMHIPHWGLDIVSPDQTYNAALFKRYALDKIHDIRSRGHVPFLVGGTGLYVDGIIYDYQFPLPPGRDEVALYETMSVKELQTYCVENNIELPINNKNKRHLIHAIIYKDQSQQRQELIIDNTIVVGIAIEKDVLEQSIIKRTEQMFSDGVVEEAKILGKKYGWDSEAMTGNIYPILKKYLDREVSLEETKRLFVRADIRLAKRQLTWFRRNKQIEWGSIEECRERIQNYLASEHQI